MQLPEVSLPAEHQHKQIDLTMLTELGSLIARYKDEYLSPTRVIDGDVLCRDMMAIHCRLGLFSQTVGEIDETLRVMRAGRKQTENFWFCQLREQADREYQEQLDQYQQDKEAKVAGTTKPEKRTDQQLKARADVVSGSHYDVSIAGFEGLRRQIDLTYAHATELVNVMKRVEARLAHEWTG